jgi:hypothetical protein
MPDHDRDGIARARSALDALATELTTLGAELAARRAELAQLRATSRAARALERAERRVAKLERQRAALHERRGELSGLVGVAASGLLDELDPETAVESLDGKVPVALLPVRIETRFADANTTLHIRIFPDQVHLDAHEPAFTADERAGAEWYWNERWPALDDAARAERAWTTLAGRFRPGRARYLLDTLRPANLDRAPEEPPAFPDTAMRASSWTRAVEATALPERWVAIGFQDTLEVFRIWSNRVPDRLAAGPSPEELETPPAPDADPRVPHVQDAFRWAVDPDAARAAGILLTVRDSDMAFGRPLANGLTRLVVLGVDWTFTPEQGADALEALLAGHAASGDLAFVAPGTSTNNTGSNRSGFSTAPSEQVAAWAPPLAGADADAAPDANAGRLAGALGIAAAPLAVAPGAGGRHHALASALVDALWEATGGYYASELLDPHGSDAITAGMRAHAAAALHAAGPLPAFRVGPQPYGVLPVASRRLSPHLDSAVDLNLHRYTGMLRSMWDEQVHRVPRLGRAGETRGVDDVMLELLQRTPVPWELRWREMVAPPQWTATDWLAASRARQVSWLYDVTDRLDIPPNRPARFQYLTATVDSHPLGVPLVAKGDAGTSYVAEIAALARQGDEGRRELNLRQNSIALLEALLAFAAVQELDKAASAELVEGLTGEDRAAAGFVRRGVRTPDLVRVEEPDPHRLPMQFASARALAAQTAPGSQLAVHDQVATRLASADLPDHIGQPASPVNGLARFLAALDVLAAAPAAELEWAFRGVLDLFSSRIDAWFTSFATARLDELRADRPQGVHVGCYGWVEDLRPDRGPAADSLGYIAAPSLAHAASAALLRSGRQSHDGPFDLWLSSARVREALRLLEGVAAGQSLAALLGYRIERKLTDAGLAELIVGLRIAVPLRARASDLDAPVESVAARDVVDGVRLLAMQGTQQWFELLAQLQVSGERQTRLEAVLADDVAVVYDAVSDVLFAEAVHQTAAGNLDRAAAAAGALDRQERPVEPDVTRTPRDGVVVTNRVVVALRGSATARASGWPARGVRGSAEPRLDRWLGAVLGDPQLLTCTARLVRGDTVTELEPVSAAELGLSPLALALTAGRPAADQPTELEARLAAAFAARVTAPTDTDRIELDGASLLTTVAAWASRLVSGCRPLQVSDLAPVGGATGSAGGPAGAVNVTELRQRADAALAALRKGHATIESAPRTPAQLRRALGAVSELVGVDALASSAADVETLSNQADAVGALLADRIAAAGELRSRPLDAGESDADRLVALVRTALGAHQPILPVFKLATGAELVASASDRVALLGGDETAPVTWLHRAGLVRPELEALCGLLTHAEAAGSNTVADLSVAQLPHRPGARWCELPFGIAGPPPAGTVGVVAHAPAGFDPTRPLAGLFVDAWAEVIPSDEHTAGVTFHYDAPGARPPQAILLAVHPDLEPERWNLQYLLETLQETISLARVRTVTLRELDGMAGVIPALYLPSNYTRDVASVSLTGLVTAAQAAGLGVVPTGIRGKP